jgi:UDP-glucuronate decarboxylase
MERMKDVHDVMQSNVVAGDVDYIHREATREFSELSGNHILITGGAGFLGYYLIQSILEWNHKYPDRDPIHVTLYDNFIRGYPDWLAARSADTRLSIQSHDISRPLPDSTPDFDYIIHAASIASPTYYRKYPIETMDANVNGLRYLLEYAKMQNGKGKPVKGFLFYSTSEIYGDPTPENIPTPETYRGNVSCTGPRACYDESKRYGETLCVNFAQQFNLPVKIARPFNNYGPGLKITDKRVIPDFARDIVSNRDIIMYSDGSPTRTFCYIADAIVGYMKILVIGRPGEAYNIGVSGPEISMSELAERLVHIAQSDFGYGGKIVRKENPDKEYLTDNPNRRCPVIDKAKNELGYNPSITLEEGLKRSLQWYYENPEGEDL